MLINGQAASINTNAAEILIAGIKSTSSALHGLIVKIWHNESVQVDFLYSQLFSIYKIKGDLL